MDDHVTLVLFFHRIIEDLGMKYIDSSDSFSYGVTIGLLNTSVQFKPQFIG